ncbi:PTS transporter subunit IIC [Vibrio sp. PP-XX7]
MIMFFAMVINIVIARFTPWKFIFFNRAPHSVYVDDGCRYPFFQRYERCSLIALGSAVVGVTMVFYPAIAHRYMKQVTGSDDVAIGHFSTLSYVLAGFIGSKFGNKEHSTEDMNVPKSLLFLRDTPVAISFTMAIIFIITRLFAGVIMFGKSVAESSGLCMHSCSQSLSPAAYT